MLRWIVSLLLLAAGTLVAFRADIIPLPGIPIGLRIVLSLQLIGLLITATLENLDYLFGSKVAQVPDRAPETKGGPVATA
jgi:hypothetical protein